jgi:hypothetical protein
VGFMYGGTDWFIGEFVVLMDNRFILQYNYDTSQN